MFFFVLYIINYIVVSNNDSATFNIKEQASLSSHAAMAFAAETLLILEVIILFKQVNIFLKDKRSGNRQKYDEDNG